MKYIKNPTISRRFFIASRVNVNSRITTVIVELNTLEIQELQKDKCQSKN